MNTTETTILSSAETVKESEPNEFLGIRFSETLVIKDLSTGQTILQQRCS